MNRLILGAIVRPLAGVLRGMQSDAPQVSIIRKVLTGIVLVPVMGVIVVILRLRSRFGGPIPVTGETVNGDRLQCHLPDLIQMYIYLFGWWEPDLTVYIRDHLRPGDTLIDVGANIGYFTLLASRCVGANGQVIAFEPAPRIVEALESHVRDNAAANVRIVPCAVSREEGTITVYGGPAHNLGLTTTRDSRGLPAEADVPCGPLGAYVDHEASHTVRLVKIDVEGGEPAVLAGMVEWLDHAPSDVELLVELSPLWWADRTQTVEDVLRPFTERGFNVYTIPNNYWPWRYLWPHDVGRPRRSIGALSANVKRHDLVLSRRDQDML
ncbi:MAG: FkbM family methyltransferase [Planctomycetota bacterium]